MALFVHRSNRLERLVDILAEIVQQTLLLPLEPEVIMISSQGMEQYLSMALASRLSIWANPSFPFPRTFFEQLVFHRPRVLELRFSDPQALIWSIADRLPTLLQLEEFDPIRRYLDENLNERKLFQLASEIAATFDRYSVFRPRLLRAWSNQAEKDAISKEAVVFEAISPEATPPYQEAFWQAHLWNALIQQRVEANLSGELLADRLHECLTTLENTGTLLGLPRRLILFGVISLPPLFADAVARMAQYIDIYAFFPTIGLNAAADSDQISSHPLRQLSDIKHIELSAYLLELRSKTRDNGDVFVDHWEEPEGDFVLATVQSDLLNRYERSRSNVEIPARVLDENDHSITFHSCHGPLREVEVLHDRLLGLFDEIPGLEPRDIVVLLPDVDAYAPLVEAVFGFEGGGQVGEAEARSAPIPYRLAERNRVRRNLCFDGLQTFLSLVSGRFEAGVVLDFLSRDAVHRRFEIHAEELEIIRGWTEASGIRWGLDAGHRQLEHQPAFDEYTWSHGLNRLFLSYAFGPQDEIFAGVAPTGVIEGDSADLLGKFAHYCQTLFSMREYFRRSHTASEWAVQLLQSLDRLFWVPRQEHWQLQTLREGILKIKRAAEDAGSVRPVALEVIRDLLPLYLEDDATDSGFMSQGVTFCAMRPMRGIPFRVVCLLGLNHDSFPRGEHIPGFDLMRQHPQPGDRNVRDDDRLLFVESLLAARDRVIITYVGRDIHTNTDMPPSTVMSELLDTLCEMYILPEENSDTVPSAITQRALIRSHFLIRHPLQPFSPSYFESPRHGEKQHTIPPSYHEGWFAGASALVAERRVPNRFLANALPETEEKLDTVLLEDFLRFYEHPVRTLLQQRLGVRLETPYSTMQDREPFELHALAEWQLGEWMLKMRQRGASLDKVLQVLRSKEGIPLGSPGKIALEPIITRVEAIMREVQPFQEQKALRVRLECAVGEVRLVGQIQGIYAGHLSRTSYRRLPDGRDMIRLWIQHLALAAALEQGQIRTEDGVFPPALQAVLVGRHKVEEAASRVLLKRVPDPVVPLKTLIERYQFGQRLPLRFFPRTSFLFARALLEAGGGAEAQAKALATSRRQFADRESGEGVDVYNALVFGSGLGEDTANETLDETFIALAQEVFRPLLYHADWSEL